MSKSQISFLIIIKKRYQRRKNLQWIFIISAMSFWIESSGLIFYIIKRMNFVRLFSWRLKEWISIRCVHFWCSVNLNKPYNYSPIRFVWSFKVSFLLLMLNDEFNCKWLTFFFYWEGLLNTLMFVKVEKLLTS